MVTSEQIESIVAALDQKDYQTVTTLLQPLLTTDSDHPWVQLFSARLHEATGKGAAAEDTYRRLLQQTTNPRIAFQARQGLQRLEDAEKAQRQEAIARATADPSASEPGFLVLEPLADERRHATLAAFARIMKLDLYTARIHLSHRGWKLYRAGAIGELQMYGQELQAAGIPAFWVTRTAIANIRVFRVNYVQAIDSPIRVICQNESGQQGTLSFTSQEVARRVEGQLPIFEDVVDVGAWNQLQRKEQTQDYAQLCDLHLPGRKCILRFCDMSYQFQQGIHLDDVSPEAIPILQTTNRLRWNRLMQRLAQPLQPAPVRSDFTPFAETALDHLSLIGNSLESHVDLFRKRDTPWDQAFHLFSGLVFLRPA